MGSIEARRARRAAVLPVFIAIPEGSPTEQNRV